MALAVLLLLLLRLLLLLLMMMPLMLLMMTPPLLWLPSRPLLLSPGGVVVVWWWWWWWAPTGQLAAGRGEPEVSSARRRRVCGDGAYSEAMYVPLLLRRWLSITMLLLLYVLRTCPSKLLTGEVDGDDDDDDDDHD